MRRGGNVLLRRNSGYSDVLHYISLLGLSSRVARCVCVHASGRDDMPLRANIILPVLTHERRSRTRLLLCAPKYYYLFICLDFVLCNNDMLSCSRTPFNHESSFSRGKGEGVRKQPVGLNTVFN